MIIPPEYFSCRWAYQFVANIVSTPNILFVPIYFPFKYYGSFETYTLDDLIESLIFYKKDHKIVFDGSGEGYMISHLKNVNLIVEILVNKFKLNQNDFFYLSGVLPVELNSIGYKNIINRNNFIELDLVMCNSFEVRVKKACNDINYLQFEVTNRKKNKKFISFNGCPRIHRICLTMLMIERNLLDYGHFSFGLNHEKYSIEEKNIPNYITSWAINNNNLISIALADRIQNIFNKHIGDFPMSLTKDHNTVTPDIFPDDIGLANDAYFNIIMETGFFDKEASNGEIIHYKESIFITEKTFRGFVFPIPFVLLNRPFSLQGLRDYGYKTFHPYINENYDKILDDEQRMLAVLDEIERLCKLSESEWEIILKNLAPIFEHNFNKLLNSDNYFVHSADR